MEFKISASTNPPKTEKEMFEYIKKLDETNVDYIHCDVMDGQFVPSITYGTKIIKKIKKCTKKPLDVHLMIKKPSFKLKRFIKVGANILTIHYESYKNKKRLIRDLQKIKKLGSFAGLSFSPSTPVLDVLPYLYFCDLVLVMSVVPGKSGQKFMNETFLRLKSINQFLQEKDINVVVEVDGGVDETIISKLKELNVEMFAIGSYLYNSKNLSKTIDSLK